jgi:hypothetical protein
MDEFDEETLDAHWLVPLLVYNGFKSTFPFTANKRALR